jgi:hypothetical protein
MHISSGEFLPCTAAHQKPAAHAGETTDRLPHAVHQHPHSTRLCQWRSGQQPSIPAKRRILFFFTSMPWVLACGSA